MENSVPLHTCHVHNFNLLFNRSHAFLHSTAIAFLIYYRTSFLFLETKTRPPIIPWLLLFASELLLTFSWLLNLSYRWRPVSRKVFPERLPGDDELPAIDVFICTADPDKEPTLGVMNTVLSSMALEYPPGKLHVYLSDDGGSPLTLKGMREAWSFARWWLPFCRKYGVKTRCPQAYFMGTDEDDDHGSSEFAEERKNIKEKYEQMKEAIMQAKESSKLSGPSCLCSHDHPPAIEVIEDNPPRNESPTKMPLLVYVSRGKTPSHPHHFKAGALNVLLRVSAIVSNSPYILLLDCDMYCNDPSSAKQAMCFHFDPKLSSSLAVVQFPQKFYNINNNDIYDSQLRSFFSVGCCGLDGLRGPVLCGTNLYIKREALCGKLIPDGINLEEVKNTFGPSNEFIKSLVEEHKPNLMINDMNSSGTLKQEANVLASCAYEDQTQWGEKVGFRYRSVAEDYFTGFMLHCKGWRSVYLSPSRPQFLGTGVTNLNDLLVQGTRWGSGVVEVGISRFCPLIYGPQQGLPLLQSMAYAELAIFPLLYCLSLWCFATIPQLCLLNGIPLYPEVSSPYFSVFLLTFRSGLFKHLHEVLMDGRAIQTWRNEQRTWMIKSVTAHLYGSLDAIMKKLGLREASFMPTSKIMHGEQLTIYKKGFIDFQASTMLISPLVTLAILNVVSLAGGIIRMMVVGDWRKMLGQVLLSCYILVINYAVIEGMLIRRDKGRIPSHVTLLSAIFPVMFLLVVSLILIMF
ncbi:hypothetical protein SLA2020_162490 [Shorea laevis]